MAADFLKDKFREDELRKKYNNYFVPACKIKVGAAGKDLTKSTHAKVESIRISMSLDNSASATISVTNVYDMENHCFSDAVKKNLALGNTIKIELGYDSELEDVFHGFIFEVSAQFGGVPSMQITAMDVKRLMADNCRENYKWEEKKYSEIFKEILGDYDQLNLDLVVDSRPGEKSKSILQKGSDLSMVRQICKAANKKFLVIGDKAYFTDKDEKSPITTLSFGRDLISFSQSASYVDMRIEVWGNLKGSPQKLVEKRTVKSSPGLKRVRQTATSKIITLTDIDSQNELVTRADEEEEALMERIQSGSGSCMGIPVLIPGRYIKIKGLDLEVDGEYYLRTVNHSFGSDGFSTDFTLGGKK